MSPNPPRPKQPSRPEVITDLTPETPVRKQRRFDNPKPLDPLPPPPRVPGEFGPTLPSPVSIEGQEGAGAAALRRVEELERRVATTTAPSSDPLGDEAIRKLVKAVVGAITKRFGAPAALVAMLSGGGGLYHYATTKPAPPPLTAAEFNERLAESDRKIVGRLDGLTNAVNGNIDVTRCMRKKTNQIGESLLPAPDRMGPARRPAPFEDDCPEGPKRLPEPRQ